MDLSKEPFLMRHVRISCVALSILEATTLPSGATSLTCDQVDKQIASTPVISDSANALRRHLNNIANLPQKADVVLIGDSLIQAWPADLSASLANGTPVVNLGVGRDRIQNTLWLLTSSAHQLKQIQPKVVILLVGTNNVYLDKPCGIEMAFGHLFEQISRLWPKSRLVQILILPRGQNMQGAAETISEVNASLLSRQKEVPNYRAVDAATIACQSGVPCANYREDLLHLTKSGYEKLTHLVKEKLLSR
jgi:lysophospholipase L1-like esterase